jgi:hypothetical protein
MKTFLFSLTLLFSFQVFALDWYDLELEDKVTLEKEINFSKEDITLKAGDGFKLYDIITLPINVQIYQFEVLNCPGPDITTDMIIIDPSKAAGDPSVGVQLSESCSLDVFVETKDLFTKSLFLK